MNPIDRDMKIMDLESELKPLEDSLQEIQQKIMWKKAELENLERLKHQN